MLPITEWSRVGSGHFTTKIEKSQNAKIERLTYIKAQSCVRLTF